MLDQRQLPFVLAGMFLMTLQPVLVTLSQNEEGKIEYSAISSTLLTELLKILISLLLFFAGPRSPRPFELRKSVEFAVPAAIYFVNNNLVFAILQLVSATTFQLLSQLKTVFTGLLFRFFLGRKLTFIQYIAIWQLACGTAISQIPPCLVATSASSAEGDVAAQANSFSGLTLAVISCVLSAFGGIYSEKLLKDQPKESIHMQNIQLYAWGILFNFSGVIYQDSAILLEKGFFTGYNGWACAVVVNNALNGLAISAILKHADNIARVYAHACAMLLTMVLSVLLFGQSPTPQLVIAVAVVGASTVQYNAKPEIANGIEEKKRLEAEDPTSPMKRKDEDDFTDVEIVKSAK